MNANNTTEMKEKDLNVTLPTDDIYKLKADALSLRVPMKEYARVAFRKFLDLPINVRRAAFCNSRSKTVGRKVKA